MKRWWLVLLVILAGAALWQYSHIAFDFFRDLPGLRDTTSRTPTAKPAVPSLPSDPAIETLRREHRLRALTDREYGMRLDDLPNGVYGFSTCGDSLKAYGAAEAQLEVQKRHDRIAYYVGYASRDDIGKYLARQKNFHIRLSPSRGTQTSSILEIPVYFVAQCTPIRDGRSFDLLVRDIPELQS